ncbi:MAG: ECF transporter S component [Anaerolineae bacterium]|nr:ECF transporter S component [Anaerolineae bacterium]
MAALIFVLTTLPRIPVPATGGYVHLGDAGITFAASAFGPWVAMAAGGLGTAMADLLGFPQWAIFSLIVHGVQGLLVGLALRKGLNVVRGIAAAVISIAVVVGGYFIAGVILESQAVAALEILPNTLQALSGSIIGFPLYWAVRRAYPPLDKYSERSG